MKSKTIIISAIEENNTRGILTLFQEDDLLKCRLRVYNLSKISRYCKLGIYHENEVYSANLIERNNVYESSFVGSFDIDKDFYVALIDTSKDNQVLLAGGTYQGFYFNDNSVFLNSENFSNNQKNENQNFLNNSNIIEQDCLEDCDKCANCKYKEFFYSQQNELTNSLNVKTEKNTTDGTFLSTNKFVSEININSLEQNDLQGEQINQENKPNNPGKEQSYQQTAQCDEVLEKEKIKNIVNSILPQFDNLFANYEADEQLNSLIENSKFVKINENGEQFSIGAIYEENNLKFICYAIRRDYNINPPEELGEHYQWLPIDSEDPLSVGYYVVFQDASDLKIVEL